MDLLSCQTGSRCATCHHFTSGRCELLALLDAYEASLAPPAPAGPALLAWAGAATA